MQNPVSTNPNASVTAFAGAITILLVWVAGMVSLPVTAEVASAFTTVIATIILWAGRRGRRSAGAALPEPSPTS